MIVLETHRLILRHLVVDDIDALYALYRDPQMRAFYPDGTRTREQTMQEINWFTNGHPHFPELGLWATIDKETGALVGRNGLLPWEIDGVPEVELAYLIDKSRWGEGMATEAATGIMDHARHNLGINRLICLIMPGNDASIRVAEKIGMSFERDYIDEMGPCHIFACRLQ